MSNIKKNYVSLNSRYFHIVGISVLIVLFYIIQNIVGFYLGFIESEGSWQFFCGVFLLIIIHEGSHMMALLVCGENFGNIKFGFSKKWLAPYCHASSMVRLRTYRLFLIFPLLITGPMAILILFFYPTKWLVFLTAMTFSGCTADVWLFFKLWSMDGNLFAQDSASELGVELFERDV